MNRRVLAILIAGVLVLGVAYTLMTLNRPAPAADAEASRSAAAPREEPKPAAPSAPVAAAPPASSARPAEPRRRPAAPAPAATATPAVAAPDAGLVTLRVNSDIEGAQVFVDRNFVGKTPFTTTEIKPGSHRINVSAPGYEGVAESVDLSPGSRDVMLKLREVRLDARLAVVHKHRIGSCSGRLVATPQGIVYETTNKDDAFRSGLLDLDTFEVDYLEKNLRVKPKQGKRYDFTDPDGNADRLFVFQRDVDKARERLRKGDPPAQ